jgi:hypothetical protein
MDLDALDEVRERGLRILRARSSMFTHRGALVVVGMFIS